MTSLALAVASDLVFDFRGVDEALLEEIARFLGYYPVVEDCSDPLVVSSDPPPVQRRDGSRERVLVEEEHLRVRRAGTVTLFDQGDGILAWCDSARGTAGISVDGADAEAREYFVWRVLAGLLMELAESRGWIGLHGAGAVIAGRGLLLTGASGVGKSTLIGRLHQAGHGVLSDDLIWLTESERGFDAVAFPRGPARPPAPAPTVRRTGLAAIVCPTIVDREASRLTPLSSQDVLSVLIEQSGFLGSAAATARRFKSLVRLAASLPGHRLEAGRRQEEIPPLLADLAATLA